MVNMIGQVEFFNHMIQVTSTTFSYDVDEWITKIERIHWRRRRWSGLIVGLDIEWHPNFIRNSTRNPVAVLQLCVGHHCLVFQICHADEIPQSLYDFLEDENYTFVGVGIHDDVQKIYEDYELDVKNVVDLRDLAAYRWDDNTLLNAGLTTLGSLGLGMNYNKPKQITLSNWATVEGLSLPQIHYACIDAFLSFEIGRYLDAHQYYDDLDDDDDDEEEEGEE